MRNILCLCSCVLCVCACACVRCVCIDSALSGRDIQSVCSLTSKERQARAQKENLVSTSPGEERAEVWNITTESPAL